MANQASNVRVAVSGAFYKAPLATPLPTSAAATPPLNTAFVDLGYISEDGVTQTIDADTSDIKAWQNGDIVRTIQTSHKVSYQMTMIETKKEVLELFYSDPDATAAAVKITGKQAKHETYVLDVLDGDKTVRLVIPDGQVTERGEVTFKNEEAIGYQVTIVAYPDNKGVKVYQYMA